MNYDTWKTNAPEDDGPDYTTPCPICTGAEDEPPCSEECERLIYVAGLRSEIVSLYKAAKLAVHWAKVYRKEEGPRSQRERDCLLAVREYRWAIRGHRAAMHVDPDAVLAVALAEDVRTATTLPAPAEEAAQ